VSRPYPLPLGPLPNFGRYLREHPAGMAGTVHTHDEHGNGAAKRHVVAEYPRAAGSSFRVVHDPLAHPPYGLHRVYVAEALIGSQLSFPSRDDCVRMDRPLRSTREEGPLDPARLSNEQQSRLRGAHAPSRDRGRPRDAERAYANRRAAGWPGSVPPAGPRYPEVRRRGRPRKDAAGAEFLLAEDEPLT
jgi:hypothetical protein